MEPGASTFRVLDASLNRATEGLRVVEDYARFALDDALIVGLTKELRHDLASVADRLPRGDRLACRDTPGDVGTEISTDAEASRSTAWEVCVASQERLQQALRSLEEFSKLHDSSAADRFEALRYRAYTLGKALSALHRSIDRLANTRLYVLIDGRESAEAFQTLVASICEAGADAVQLRDRRLDDRSLVERARSLTKLARRFDALAIVNDRADIAAAAGADGVHLGQDDLAVPEARTIVGPHRLVGVSTHDVEQLRRAVLDGADYVGVGPTFATPTKRFDEFPGVDFVRAAAAETALPAFAIGGITAETLPRVVEAGATRVAVASAVTAADDPAAAVRGLKAMLQNVAPTPVGG